MKKTLIIGFLVTCLTSVSSFALEKCETAGIAGFHHISFHCLLAKPYIEGKPGDPFFPKRLVVSFSEAVYMKCVITPQGPLGITCSYLYFRLSLLILFLPLCVKREPHLW